MLAAEELLQLAGFDITPDDRFTNGTQDLVVQFQQRHGLPADGIVDIDTWRVLLALAFRAERPPLAAGPATRRRWRRRRRLAATTTSRGAHDDARPTLSADVRAGRGSATAGRRPW